VGCNAWNHPSNCKCGWGGDTGGGGWSSRPAATSSWTRTSAIPPPIRLSCTIPNATCPVCGATVFFYVSPHGGRVFFDSLGPPWPKHPCTDNPRVAVTRLGSGAVRAPRPPPEWKSEGWSVLSNLAIRQEGKCTFVTGTTDEPLRHHTFGFEGSARFTKDDPILCRRAPNGIGEFELSYLPINSRLATVRGETITVFPHARNADAVAEWLAAIAGDSEAQNLLGMRLSFHRDTELAKAAGTFPNEVDWAAAEHWFRLAAAQGHWAGHHNLGVMYLHGYGVEVSPSSAFQHLSEAAESEEPASLRRLADLYEAGIGTKADPVRASELRELAERVSGSAT
jgi:hypothetical protein